MVDHKREPLFTDLIHNQYVNNIQKIAIPSLSYEPATDLEMYPEKKWRLVILTIKLNYLSKFLKNIYDLL